MAHASNLSLATVAAALILSPAFAAEPYGKWLRPSNRSPGRFLQLRRQALRQGRGQRGEQRQGWHCIVSGAAKTGGNEWKGSLLNPDDGKSHKGLITRV